MSSPDPDFDQAKTFHELLQYEIVQASAAIESIEQQLSRAQRFGHVEAERRHRAAVLELRNDLYELHRLDRALVLRFGITDGFEPDPPIA
ncbi:hypothetical protein OG921_19410 [Aldersonia sp. NBC_00410]|uniref:hypothetical protein n=1 Tax=Aldersonia sp. NBC_00410 TaxID=2975954 RepID=UPI002250E64F|nr:hypothetical protein [Aldersonia sp. NBC_00410]MCX5045338.1 hypothetical protein [Aldersonia sp. NBC_00410]